MNHTNHKQFIDLVSVTSAANTISLSYAARRRQRHAVRLERRRGRGPDQHDRQLHVGELQHQGRQQRQCGDRRSDGAEWRQRRKASRGTASIFRISPSARRPRSPMQRTAPAALTVSDGRTPRRAPRQLHRRKLRHCRRRPWRHAAHASLTNRAAAADASASVIILADYTPRTAGRGCEARIDLRAVYSLSLP